MARTTDKLKNFEANYEKLENLVRALDAPELTLKESLDLYEKAVKLAEACEEALNYAQQRADALADVRSMRSAGDDDGQDDEGALES